LMGSALRVAMPGSSPGMTKVQYECGYTRIGIRT
jgi:hypothetical protein